MSSDSRIQLGLHQREAAAYSPLLQAAISGGIMFVVALVVVIMINKIIEPFMPIFMLGISISKPGDPFMPALVVGMVTLAVVWFGRLMQWLGLTERIEELTGIDLPGGHDADEIAELRAEIEAVKAEKMMRVENKYYTQDGALAGGDTTFEDGELVLDIATAIYYRGIPFTVAAMVDENKVIDRKDYDRLTADEKVDKSTWIKADGSGYLEWVNPSAHRKGCRPTKKGEVFLRNALEGSPPAPRR